MKLGFRLFIFVALVILSFAKNLPHNFSKILDTMLVKYDYWLRPNFIVGRPLQVGIQLSIISIDSISEVNMDYTITMHLHQFWTDERLAFKSTKLNSSNLVDFINLSGFADRIWLPDIFFLNHKSSYIPAVTQKNEMIRLHNNGSILYSLRFTTTLACMMDLHDYPMDTQNCKVELSSYGYTMNDVLLYWKEEPIVGLNNLSLSQFIVKKYNTQDNNDTLSTGTYQHLILLIELQRNIGYFIFQMYLPSILIVILSWVSFWINHEATSARVTLGITTVLTITTINTGMRSSLPRISYVKAIDIYLVVCFVFVFGALVEFAAVNYKHWTIRAPKSFLRFSEKSCTDDQLQLEERKEKDETETQQDNSHLEDNMIKRRHRTGVIRFQQNLIQTSINNGEDKESDKNYGKSKTQNPQIRFLQKNKIDKISRFVFPISFVMFNIFYWGFYIIY